MTKGEPIVEEIREEDMIMDGVRDYLTHPDPLVRELAKRVLAKRNQIVINNA